MLTPRLRAILVLGALLLGLAVTGGPARASQAAHVATAVSAAGIFGPCNSLENGEVRNFGRNYYLCKYVAGFGGYYWVGPIDESCNGTNLTTVRQAKIC